jgi:hypothetical protein
MVGPNGKRIDGHAKIGTMGAIGGGDGFRLDAY